MLIRLVPVVILVALTVMMVRSCEPTPALLPSRPLPLLFGPPIVAPCQPTMLFIPVPETPRDPPFPHSHIQPYLKA